MLKSVVFASLALAVGAFSLAGCQNEPQPQAKPTATEPAAASEGISVSDGRLVLPAVKGNPGALYFTLHNGTGNEATVTGAEVTGAESAMMHQSTVAEGQASMEMLMQAEVPAKGELVFAPGGRHVMAMNLGDSLKPGGTTEATLTFADGATIRFPAQILAAGDAR